MRCKRGQITIFIVLAIVIVGAVVAYFLVKSDILPELTPSKETNPNVFLESCIEPKVKEAVDLINTHGGYIDPTLYKKFDYEKRAYLCYNQNNFLRCVNQEPMLFKHLEDEIKKYISEDMKKCWDDLKISLEKQGYSFKDYYNDFDIELIPKKVLVNIDAKINFDEGDENFNQEGFKVITASRLYELAVIAQEIVSQEAEYCDFNHLGYMLLHPEMNIGKRKLSDGTNVYSIEDKKTEEEFWFATKSCSYPGGI